MMIPYDVLHLIVEAPEDYRDRAVVASKLCLTCKGVRRWLEPFLYQTVTIETSHQSHAFYLTVKKRNELAMQVRALYLINFPSSVYGGDSNVVDILYYLKDLEKLALSNQSFRALYQISYRTKIRELILVRPKGIMNDLRLGQLPELKTLHILNPDKEFTCR